MAAASTSGATTVNADGSQLTYNETVEVICGFVKTAIHTILCHRQVYPPSVFSRRQRYRVPVWASRHPGLTSYIDEVVDAAKVQVEKSALQSIHVVLTSVSSREILERYRFDISVLLPNVQPRDRNLSIPGNMTMETVELHMRSFMMKLISLDGALGDIENVNDLTWAIVLDMKDGNEPQTDDSRGNEAPQGPWVPFDEVTARPGAGREGDDEGPMVLPVKSLDTGVINLMLYVEEHPLAKRASQAARTPLLASSGLQTRAQMQAEREQEESSRVGERDIDAPLPQPSSSGAVRSKGKGKRRPRAGSQEEGSESSGSDDSGDSIRSVNDFAGYGKGAGSVGMSGVGM